MSADPVPIDAARVQAAIVELLEIIKRQYPTAAFRVERGQDDPDAIHLVAIVDIADTGELLDLVIDRLMEIQTDDELPIFVIPLRPPCTGAEEPAVR